MAGVAVLCLGTVTASLSQSFAHPPLVVAHRALTADAPENTIAAIQNALTEHADMIWLSVQVSADGIPVLYRPTDLEALTDVTGAVSSYTADQLAQMNAGWAFRAADGTLPYRNHPVGIPTVQQALDVIPADVPIVFDVKTPAANPAVPALMAVVGHNDAWQRTLFYSTQQEVNDSLTEYSNAVVFESRDVTRRRLLDVLLTGVCTPPSGAVRWVGYEVTRDLSVSEEYTLGSGTTDLAAAMWTEQTMACTRQDPDVRILFFGVNSQAEFQIAGQLEPDAILTDSIPGHSADLEAVGWRAGADN